MKASSSVGATLHLHPEDPVAVARSALMPGQVIPSPWGDVVVRDKVPPLHKVALRPLRQGEVILKYGHPIGTATGDIEPGSHVHEHNLTLGGLARREEAGGAAQPLPPLPGGAGRTFQGYARPGGRAGTRNYLAVISSVNCSASVSRYVADRFRGPEFARQFPGVDGVVALTHKGGCAMTTDEPKRLLQRVLAGMARHPNITGYVLIGLGCEVNQVGDLFAQESLGDPTRGEVPAAVLNIQQEGGVQRTVESAVRAMTGLLPAASALKRTPQPLSRLTLALNCGGSDAASGITANPAVGAASDLLIRHGGASVLAETTEIFGAEHLLTRRAVRPEVARQVFELMAWWEGYVRANGACIDNNPSFGNKQGGLTTIFEKSLGAVAKAGHAPLEAVVRYAEPVTCRGLTFMDTPGYDPVSMTGLVAGGCNLAVFTTGRGSVYGCKPTPCVKVATRTALFEWMREDMDFNAGTVLDGAESVEEAGARLFEMLIATASGEKTRSEVAGMGDEEFAPWMLGPVL